MSCGIYCIENAKNGRRYIGQSVNIESRLKGHLKLLRENNHWNKHLQSAFNKYGETSFKFYHLEYCKRDTIFLTKLEQKWMDKFENKYNQTPSAGSTAGYKHSEDFRRKISNALKGRKITWSSKISKAKKGVLHNTKAQLAADKMQSKLRKGKVGPTKGMKIPAISQAMKIVWNERRKSK